MSARFFTVEEADACLPRLIELIEQIRAASRVISASKPDVWPVLKKSIGNGGSKQAGELLPEFERYRDAIQAIEDMGVQLKDPEQGLVDFLHRRPDGREVYLCWHYGEERVTYWHDLHAGYAGRRPLGS
jgi:hypothetical protein